MNTKRENVFLMVLMAVGFFSLIGAQKASAGACLDGKASCWAVNDCASNTSGGKSLVAYPAGDPACANAYAAPVKCCKISGTASSNPAATSKGSDSSSGATQSGSTNFVNPLKFSNVEEFLGGIMVAIQRIIVALALVFIMIGAVMILTSAGNSGMVEKGKAAITMALVGLALGVAAPSLLKELANIIGWGGATSVAGALTLTQIAMRVLNFLLGTMGILALVMMVIGASMYLTSAGDDDRIKKGKEIFKYSLLGVVLAMSSMVLVTQVAKFFTN